MSKSHAGLANLHWPRTQPCLARFRNHELAAVRTSGIAVAAFTIAASRRVYDQQSGQWKDGDTLFLRCSAWRQLAEHIAESLSKGSRAIVTGRLKQRDYETTDSEKRTVYEVDADDAGPSLRWATAKVTKAARERPPHPADAADDPWASSSAETAVTSAAGSFGSDPPF